MWIRCHSNCNVKGRLSEVSKDIVDQVVAEVKATPFFVLQWDETTDVTLCDILLFMPCDSVKDL